MKIRGNKLESVLRSNAMSVIKKLLTGAFVIMFVGICVFVSLLLLIGLI